MKLKNIVLILLYIICTPLFGQIKLRTPYANIDYNHYNQKGTYATFVITNTTQVKPLHYISFDNSHQSYYHKYDINNTHVQNVIYTPYQQLNNNFSLNNKPFEETQTINIGYRQNAFGPPQEGCIGGVLLPILVFSIIYFLIIRNKKKR